MKECWLSPSCRWLSQLWTTIKPCGLFRPEGVKQRPSRRRSAGHTSVLEQCLDTEGRSECPWRMRLAWPEEFLWASTLSNPIVAFTPGVLLSVNLLSAAIMCATDNPSSPLFK